MGYVFFYGLNDLFPITETVSDTGKAVLSTTVADWVVPIVPMGITFVRAGNTINGEL